MPFYDYKPYNSCAIMPNDTKTSLEMCNANVLSSQWQYLALPVQPRSFQGTLWAKFLPHSSIRRTRSACCPRASTAESRASFYQSIFLFSKIKFSIYRNTFSADWNHISSADRHLILCVLSELTNFLFTRSYIL
jgi:hypothetical protein